MIRILALAAALGTGVPAAAQSPSTTPPPSPPAADQNQRAEVQKSLDTNFDKADVNNDDFLSEQEVGAMAARLGQQLSARLEQEFKTLDKDKNGQLSFEEFRAVAAGRMAQLPANAMQQLDANKDGKISAAEFKTPALSAFDRIDLNKDGTLSPDEKQKATAPR